MSAAPVLAGAPPVVRDLWAAAAVLERFGAGDLLDAWLKRNTGADPEQVTAGTLAALDLQAAAKPALDADGAPALRLPTELRQAVLKELGASAVRQVLDAAPPQTLTNAESYLRRLLDEKDPGFDLASITSRDDLIALRAAADSAVAAGMKVDLDREAVTAEIRKRDLMLSLGGPDLHRFVGRTRELDRLDALWVGQPWPPAVLIEGPGGMGKSLLISRFVSDRLDARRTDGPRAVFHLDFDRRDLQNAGARGLAAEIARQALRWAPGRTLEQLVESLGTGQGLESFSPSRGSDGSVDVLLPLLGVVEALRTGPPPRLLLVLDSCEQILGFNDVTSRAAADVGRALRRAGAEVFMIYGSRSFQTAAALGWEDAERISLGQFTDAEARTYLRAEAARCSVAVDDALADRVIGAVGRSPLALRLAAAVLQKEGGAFDPGRWADNLRDDPERLQAVLYDRMLKRIRDPNLRKLALPGLLVRRLTEAVITEVLAAPCGIDLTRTSAESLMAKGGQEGQLFVKDTTDMDRGALWHRQDVRALMLPDLDTRIAADVAQRINANAIAYYERLDDDVSRAEEIYHRLRMGQGLDQIGPRWIEGAGRRLRGALAELSPDSQSVLRRFLGTASLSAVAAAPEPAPGAPTAMDAGSLAELRAVVLRELQTATAGADPTAMFTRYGVASLEGPLGDLYAEALLSGGRVGELIEAAVGLADDPVDPTRAGVLSTAAGAAEGLHGGAPEPGATQSLKTAAHLWNAAASYDGSGPDEGLYTALGARIGRLRAERKLGGGAETRDARLADVREFLRRLDGRLTQRRVLAREVAAELEEGLGDRQGDPYGMVRNVLFHLLETGEAFPSAISDPGRLAAIGIELIGIPSSSLNELGAQVQKLAYGGPDDISRLVQLLRAEVDWTLHRAVNPLARSDDGGAISPTRRRPG